jgi:hypothetical protein
MKKVTIFIYAILFSLSFAQERVMLEGEYTYKWGDNETVLIAKSLCYNMALRNMVESYQIFVASTTDIHNYEVRNDLIQTLSAGFLEDLTIVEERVEKEKNIAYYKLRAYVQPVEFKRVLQQQVKRKLNLYKPKPVSENESLIILKEWENIGANLSICVIAQAKKDQGYGHYIPIRVTYYDREGVPIDGEKGLINLGRFGKGEVRRGCVQLSKWRLLINTGEYGHYEIW